MMGVLTDTLTRSALVPLNTTVEVLQPALAANPNHTGEVSRDWTTPTVVATVLGTLQPASTRALERTGRVGKVGVFELITKATTITPLGRVRIGAQHYTVLDVRAYDTHAQVTIEEVSP